MKQYDVIISDSVSRLVQAVDKQCQKGWEPIGGIAVWPMLVNGSAPYLELKGHQFAQAMVKEEK